MGETNEVGCTLSNSDWIGIIGIGLNIIEIVATIIVAVWIVNKIQEKQSNKRTLKDHLIAEIKEIRNDYKVFLNALYSNKTNPKIPIPWFKLMNIRVTAFMELLHENYSIEKDLLLPYQNELRDLITENTDFMRDFNREPLIIFSDISKAEIILFQQRYIKLFNQLIVKINDAN